ncbi:MAG: type II toxin-antitoxin system VapC family toxin [Methanoregula sp.]|nr:type II toxin-antitoxin system VapC family toxin [Methanoregula sp.]
MTVIDTSAFMKFFLHENGWEDVLPWLTTASSPETVDLLVTESANVLWKSARAGLIKKEQVPLLYSSMELLYTKGPLAIKPATQFMAEALSIAISLDTPVYDALFIAKAHSDHATLVTADRHQALCAKKCGVVAILV